MARLLGPDAGTRAVFLPSGAPATNKTGTVYSDTAGTVLADIATYDGTATPGAVITGSQVTADAYGRLPLFWFPDGEVDRLYITVNSGPLVAIDADYNARIDALAVRVTAMEPGGGSAALRVAQNLADLASAATARTNLGLGDVATRNVGTTTGTAAAGDDSRLSDARTPLAHAASHATGGTDPMTPAAIGAIAASFAGASTLSTPLWKVLFSDTPGITDQNIAEWRYTDGVTERLTAWLNEIGHYRAEQTGGTLYDHLITLIASNATGDGRLLRFQRRDGGGTRVDTGGVNQDGRLETSFYAWQSFSSFGANYSAATSNSFGGTPYPLAGRVETDDIARLRGGITVGGSATTNGDVMCVVPAALRPTSPVILNATAAGAAGAIEINPNGNLICRRSGTTSASYLSLDGLSYTLTAGV